MRDAQERYALRTYRAADSEASPTGWIWAPSVRGSRRTPGTIHARHRRVCTDSNENSVRSPRLRWTSVYFLWTGETDDAVWGRVSSVRGCGMAAVMCNLWPC